SIGRKSMIKNTIRGSMYMQKVKAILKWNVKKEWIDYNGHMNDADYVRVFSLGIDAFMSLIGIDEQFRAEKQYTIFTLENHVCYLDEMKLDESFEVYFQMFDWDEECIQIFLECCGDGGKSAATREQMLRGMKQKNGRPAPFPQEVGDRVRELTRSYSPKEKPKEAGRVIGTNRKK